MGYKHISNLIQLLGADSRFVRARVLEEIEQDLDGLQAYLQTQRPQLDPRIQFSLYDLFHRVQARSLREQWLKWLDLDNDYLQLEEALSILCMQEPPSPGFTNLLDKYVDAFVRQEPVSDFFSLTRYLLGDETPRLRAVAELKRPQSGNPAHVLNTGEGHPSILACILMLCGDRLGMHFKGVLLANRYLVRATRRGKVYMFDCEDKGQIIPEDVFENLCLANGLTANQVLERTPTMVEMVARILTGLIPAYHQSGFLELYHLTVTLLNDLRSAVIESQAISTSKEIMPLRPYFKPGQLIRHKRYGYRGVVVDIDRQCETKLNWPEPSKNQMDRHQPWYHILVNDSDISAYAAQSNLGPDVSGAKINHPLIPMYFNSFQNGRYMRNEVKWKLPH